MGMLKHGRPSAQNANKGFKSKSARARERTRQRQAALVRELFTRTEFPRWACGSWDVFRMPSARNVADAIDEVVEGGDWPRHGVYAFWDPNPRPGRPTLYGRELLYVGIASLKSKDASRQGQQVAASLFDDDDPFGDPPRLPLRLSEPWKEGPAYRFREHTGLITGSGDKPTHSKFELLTEVFGDDRCIGYTLFLMAPGAAEDLWEPWSRWAEGYFTAAYEAATGQMPCGNKAPTSKWGREGAKLATAADRGSLTTNLRVLLAMDDMVTSEQSLRTLASAPGFLKMEVAVTEHRAACGWDWTVFAAAADAFIASHPHGKYLSLSRTCLYGPWDYILHGTNPFTGRRIRDQSCR